MSDIDAIKEAYEEEKAMGDLLTEQLRDMMAQNARLCALNAKLTTALESLLRWAETSQAAKTEGKAEHDDVVKGRARAALAEARAQQPPHGLPSTTA